MISGFSKPWKPVFIHFIIPNASKNVRSMGTSQKHIIFGNLRIMKNQLFDIFRKDGHRNMMKIRPRISGKSWIWDQYLSENMK